MAHLVSVNIGAPALNPYKDDLQTGIGKQPHDGPAEVRAPGSKAAGLGSGLVGDFIGDRKHHGGDDQALYAFPREDLDRWAERLDRDLPDGYFGENLTTAGAELADPLIGEVWRLGETVEVVVTAPRVPCSTFRGWTGETGWLKTFTADARPGSYLAVRRSGQIRAGDPVTIVSRPAHEITISLVFRAMTTERPLAAELAPAWDDLPEELRDLVRRAG